MRAFRAQYRDRSGAKRLSSRWYAEFRDHLEIVRRLPGFTDKSATQELARKLEKLAGVRASGEGPDRELSRWIESLSPTMRQRLMRIGLLDARRLALSSSLEDHVEAFRLALIARNRAPEREEVRERHADQTVGRIRKVFEACGLVFWSDIRPAAVEQHLRSLRESSTITVATSNAYLHALKHFGRWMVNSARASETPFVTLHKLDRGDGEARVAFTPEEVRRLLAATLAGPPRCGIAGPDRAWLYRVSVETGLRPSEVRSLTPSSFDFESNPPTVTVAAAHSKHRRTDVVKLRTNFAQELREYLATKLPRSAAFRMPHETNLARMFRLDLEAAGILKRDNKDDKKGKLPLADDQGRRIDFYCLRHTFVSIAERTGARADVLRTMARHASQATTQRYLHLRRDDVDRALELMPDFSPSLAEAAAATGTDGPAKSQSVLASCLPSDGGLSETSLDLDGPTTPAHGLENADSGSGGGIRTPDTRIMIPLLYQLSYTAGEGGGI